MSVQRKLLVQRFTGEAREALVIVDDNVTPGLQLEFCPNGAFMAAKARRVDPKSYAEMLTLSHMLLTEDDARELFNFLGIWLHKPR